MFKRNFYKLLAKYLSVYIRPVNTVVEIDAKGNLLSENLKVASFQSLEEQEAFVSLKEKPTDYVILNGVVHYKKDIQQFLTDLHSVILPQTRVMLCYYSVLWRPLMKLASALKIRRTTPEENWVSPSDIKNISELADFEVVNENKRILMPFFIPIISYIFNRYLAPLPVFRQFTLVNIAVLRPKTSQQKNMSVSVVVPARNEAGNIENIVKRFPKMGEKDELIFVEGNSTDNTWDEIQRIQKLYPKVNIKIAQQEGKGKADAVRKGFAMSENEILMILDADITVPPEDLPKFYNAIVSNKAEFINGSRLVYPMEKEAMRFFNIIGNKFFATAFSFVLNQPLKDTLCGTKVLTKENYNKIVQHRSYFGDFDPFGDFDLLFGASRMGLKIIEVPIVYKARTYGSTNIERWKHGVILLRMLLFSARKIKFI